MSRPKDPTVDNAQPIDVRHQLAYTDFVKEYLTPNKPVVITGTMDDTPAMKKWDFSFFKTNYGHRKFRMNAYWANTTEMTLNDCIDRFPEGDSLDLTKNNPFPPPYLQGWKYTNDCPELVDDVVIPLYFLPNWLNYKVLKPQIGHLGCSGPYNWLGLFIGPRGARTFMHWDIFMTHSGLAQIAGEKQVVMYSRDQTDFVYPNTNSVPPHHPEYHISNYRWSGVNQLDGSSDIYRPDLKRFPDFVKAKPLVGKVGPGDIVFIPAGWWHDVITLSPSITLNFNWVNGSNFDAFAEEYENTPKEYVDSHKI